MESRRQTTGSRLPSSRLPMGNIRQSLSQTTSITTTSIPQSSTSSVRPSSCGGPSAPCSSGSQSRLRPPGANQSLLRPPSGVPTSGAYAGPARPSGLRPPSGIPSVCPGSAGPSGLQPPSGISLAGVRSGPAPQPKTPSVCPGRVTPAASATPGSPRSLAVHTSRTGPAPTPARRVATEGAPKTPGYGMTRAAPTPSASSMITPRPSTGAIPKVRPQVVAKGSKSTTKCGKKTTVTQEVAKLQPALPEGRYALGLKYAPHTKEGKWAQFSSPPGIRRRMDENMPKGIKSSIMPPEYKGVQDVKKLTAFAPYKDLVSCAMDVRYGRGAAPPGYYADPHDYSFLERDIEPEYGSPYASRRSPEQAVAEPEYGSPYASRTSPGQAVAAEPQTILEEDVERRLREAAAVTPGKIVKVSGSRKSPGTLPVIMTDRGPVAAIEQVITEKKVEKTPGSEKISRHITGIEKQACGAIQLELDTQTLEPGGLPKRGETQKEAVSVRSSVAIGPGGIKETTTTVIYETTKPPDKINISPEELEQLVEEESLDIDKTKRFKPLSLKVISPMSYAIRKREHELKLNYAYMLEAEQAVVIPEPNPDQEQEEVQPETISSIMNTEEKGHRLGAQPSQMYDVLFPDSYEATTITVSSAAPAPLQDILVPTKLPDGFHVQGITQELENAATTTPHEAPTKPEGDVFSETVSKGEKRTPVRNVARRGTRRKLTDVPLLAKEMPPWAIEDLQPIIEIVGASPNASNLPPRAEPPTHLVVEPITDRDEEEEVEEEQRVEEEPDMVMEYTLRLEPPTHTSRVQLRGSTRPPWFPGYYVALPEIPGLVRVDKTPANVLSNVWRAVQPRYFPEDSIITI